MKTSHFKHRYFVKVEDNPEASIIDGNVPVIKCMSFVELRQYGKQNNEPIYMLNKVSIIWVSENLQPIIEPWSFNNPGKQLIEFYEKNFTEVSEEQAAFFKLLNTLVDCRDSILKTVTDELTKLSRCNNPDIVKDC